MSSYEAVKIISRISKKESKKTGINENTLTRIKNNPNSITSFDNMIALYTVYPELNKRFLNQWIEVSGIGSINELLILTIFNSSSIIDETFS